MFVRCIKAVSQMYRMFPECFSCPLLTVCDLSSKLTSSQSARNITGPNSLPCTRSCYGIHSSTRLIYFLFLLHTRQTILSSPRLPDLGGLRRGNAWDVGTF